MIPYTGHGHIEGEKFITEVDVAGNPALVAPSRRLGGVTKGTLHITTALLPSSNNVRGMLIATLVWERA